MRLGFLRATVFSAGMILGLWAASPLTFAECCLSPEHVLSTQGHSEMKLTPDSLNFGVAVEATAPTLVKLRTENNTKLQKIIAGLKATNAPHLTLQSQAVNYSPVYRSPEKNRLPVLIGYRANSSLLVSLKNLEPSADLGNWGSVLMDAALKNGASRVDGLTFFVNDLTTPRREALKKAVEDALANARIMAAAAGAKLDAVQGIDGSPQFNVGGNFRAAPMMMKSAMEEDVAVSQPALEVGETTLTSDVSIRFLLKPLVTPTTATTKPQ